MIWQAEGHTQLTRATSRVARFLLVPLTIERVCRQRETHLRIGPQRLAMTPQRTNLGHQDPLRAV